MAIGLMPNIGGPISEAVAKPRVWQRMLSGCELDLISPDPAQIQPEDMALGLSRQHRWNGQTQGAHGYSVAQHSVMVAELFQIPLPTDPKDPEKWRRAALLHDGAEYVCHDLISPLKNVVGDVFREVEGTLMKAIYHRFGLPEILPEDVRRAIKRADLQACITEAVQLAKFSEAELSDVFKTSLQPVQEVIHILPEAQARVAFLDALERYSPLLQQNSVEGPLRPTLKADDLRSTQT